MLVSGGNLYHHGKLLGLGDPITDVENWRNTTLGIHLQTGRILDVTEEEAERLRDKQKQKDIRAKGQRAIRDHERAKAYSQAVHGQIAELTKQLKEAEQALADAEQAEFEAADKLLSLRVEFGDDALGLETEPVEVSSGETVEVEAESEPEPTAEKPGFSALTADELRAKAYGAVGGYTRAQLVGKLIDWWGVDAYAIKSPDGTLLLPKGSKKDKVLAAAVAIFEARYRIAELVESLQLGEDKGPNEDVLLAVSLDAIGAAVPPEAAAALESWKDSIRPKTDDEGDAVDPEADDDATVVPVAEDS